MEHPGVLVVDDDQSIRAVLTDALSGWGYTVAVAPGGPAALETVTRELFDVALVDLHMPEMDGVTVLREIKRRDPAVDVVIMTGDPTVSTAVKALKEGAYDYLPKPLVLDELEHLLKGLIERRQLRQEVRTLRTRLGEEVLARDLIGTTSAMEELKAIIAKAATIDSSVLIEGESGTGKELVAAAIHRLSARRGQRFVPVNCGAIPADLLESEFFGHVRGAFTGAVSDTPGLFRTADGGTLFLDEVAELPPALQTKLLRVLQDKEVRPVGATRSYKADVRVVAATNRRLDESVRAGTFRQDLFYRLNVVRIEVPPLRARTDDIPALVAHFLRRLNQRYSRGVTGVAPDAMAALKAYEFEGNVRELENLVERAYALGAGPEITLADLPRLQPSPAPLATAVPDSGDIPTLAESERALILRALQRHANDKEQAARALGVSVRTIRRRVQEYGLGAAVTDADPV